MVKITMIKGISWDIHGINEVSWDIPATVA
jgi:hypothetical protein